MGNKLDFLYDKEDLEIINELEKLTDHQLKAYLVYEISQLRNELYLTNTPIRQKVELYLSELDKRKDWISFEEWRNSSSNPLLVKRQQQIDAVQKAEKIREELSNRNELANKQVLEKITNYANSSDDWMFSSKEERIEFFRTEKFQYKCYKLYDPWFLKSIEDAKFDNLKVAKNIIISIIEPIYRKRKGKNNGKN